MLWSKHEDGSRVFLENDSWVVARTTQRIGMFHSFDITLQCSGLLPRRCGSKQGSDVSMSNVRVILRIWHISPYLSSCLMISHRLRLLQQDYVNASPLSMSTVCKVLQ
ncbi:unnamed protein product [Somion occarium]|uniref:Uncharacterized protein n=1 Tax=Somion occarium TaxID=3059160 RepID=A0ABP1CT28_9APHY